MTQEPEGMDEAQPEGAPPPEGEAPALQPAAEPPPDDQPARRLMRSRRDRMIGGVAGGLADYFDIDPVLVRIAIVILTLASGGAMIIVYIGAWIVMPEMPAGSERASETGRAQAHRRARATFGVGWGILLVAIGVLLLLWQLDVRTPPWDAVLAVLLILVGLVIALEARHGLNGGLVAIAVVLTAVLGVSSTINLEFDGGFGDRDVVATRVSDLDASYGFAFGSLTVDLTDLDVPEGTTVRLDLSIAFGDLDVRLPAGVAWRVESDTFLGSTDGDGWREDGVVSNRTHTSPGYDQAARRIDIRLSNAFGSARIR